MIVESTNSVLQNLESHEISQQHDMANVNVHAMVHHGIHYLINNGLPARREKI